MWVTKQKSICELIYCLIIFTKLKMLISYIKNRENLGLKLIKRNKSELINH